MSKRFGKNRDKGKTNININNQISNYEIDKTTTSNKKANKGNKDAKQGKRVNERNNTKKIGNNIRFNIKTKKTIRILIKDLAKIKTEIELQ